MSKTTRKASVIMLVTKKVKWGKCGHPAESEDPITQNMAEVLKALLASAFASKTVLKESQVPETSRIILSKEFSWWKRTRLRNT